MLRGWGRAVLTLLLLPSASAATTLLETPPFAAAAPAAAQPFGFQAVTPYRLIDTRDEGVPVGPGQTITVEVLGQGPIPSSGVASVAINVTVTEPTEPSYLTVWPAGAAMPETSTVNFAPAATVPNAGIVGVGDDGALALFNLAGTVHVIVDVTGWFPIGGGFTGVTPHRLLDTRASPGRVPIGPEGSIDVQVTGVAGVPASGTSAVALNITATEPSAPGYLTVWPAGSALPLASSVNMLPGQTVANSVVVGVGANGSVSIFNRFGTTHVVVDITGYVEFDRGYVPVTPVRLSDSRTASQNVNGLAGPLLGGHVASLSGSFSHLVGSTGLQAFGPTAVVLNVTITRPTRPAFLTVWPHRAPLPLASNLNFQPLQTVANTVIVGTDRDGGFDLFLSGGSADVVVDLVGYFPADGLGLLDLNWNARGAALGVDTIAVAFCEPAPTDHTEEMASFNNVVAPFYAWLSGGRYAMQFTDAGRLTATDPTNCYDRLGGLPVATGTEAVLAVYGYDTNANAAWGFASTSVTADDAPSFPLDRRAGVVSLSTVAKLGAPNPFWMVVAHEFGHTLDYPHSFADTSTNLGYRQQYTNPMDLMSRQPLADRSYAPQATMAINRFRSGWIDPDQVAIHRASDSTYTIAPIGAGGTQMVVIPSSTPGRFTTLDARVRQGYDRVIDTEGVEVDVVDATCPLLWCSGINSRISPAWGGYDSVDHVLGVGEAHALGDVTVSVLSQNPDGSFVVRVTGTTYDFPPLSTSGLTGADFAPAIGYVCRLPGTNTWTPGVTLLAVATI